MSVRRLDHYSIRTTRLADTERFYTEVMGFEVGPRPAFKFPGVWLYQGGVAVVHVVGIDPDDPAGLVEYLGDKGMDAEPGTGTIDHVAFLCDGVDAMRAHFQGKGVEFRERQVPSLNLTQLFLEDPNGVTLELNFPN
jgi:catechol 2,3-dioxygenase-like lactoylglutathione lyase family enzyme